MGEKSEDRAAFSIIQYKKEKDRQKPVSFVKEAEAKP